jgi:hypothetical protein
MKKLFPLRVPGRNDQRVVEAVKYDVRKYVKRERRKQLPEGFSTWTFQCQAGPTRDTATACELADINAQIDEIANTGAHEIYIEIVAAPGQRTSPGGSPAPVL